MLVIYIGDANDVVKRITTNHCRGNVEGSAFRYHVAEKMGYKIKMTKRVSGNVRKRIDLPDPRIGEKVISEYIKSCAWKFVLCDTYDEAHDFQWYVIEKLQPLLNKDYKSWDTTKSEQYQILLSKLIASPLLICDELRIEHTGPGVYAFYHQNEPKNHLEKFGGD